MKARAQAQKVSIILNDIRSTHNVGSVFRTADAAGIATRGSDSGEILLCGYTPAPRDQFGRDRADIAKVALGAEKSIPWRQVKSVTGLIRDLQKQGAYVVAIEQAPNAIHIKKIAAKIAADKNSKTKKTSHIIFIFGNETKGLPSRVLKLCDAVAEIPMKGEKESLNVSVAVGIALYIALDI